MFELFCPFNETYESLGGNCIYFLMERLVQGLSRQDKYIFSGVDDTIRMVVSILTRLVSLFCNETYDKSIYDLFCGDGSKPWYLVNIKIAGTVNGCSSHYKCIYRYWPIPIWIICLPSSSTALSKNRWTHEVRTFPPKNSFNFGCSSMLPSNQTQQWEIPLDEGFWMGKSLINAEFSRKPCLMTGEGFSQL